MANYAKQAEQQLSLLLTKIEGDSELKKAAEDASKKVGNLKLLSVGWDDYVKGHTPESIALTSLKRAYEANDAEAVEKLLDELFDAINSYKGWDEQFYKNAFATVFHIVAFKKAVYPNTAALIARLAEIPRNFALNRKHLICNNPKDTELENIVMKQLADFVSAITVPAGKNSDEGKMAVSLLRRLALGDDNAPMAVITSASEKAIKKLDVSDNIALIVKTAKENMFDEAVLGKAIDTVVLLCKTHKVVTAVDAVKAVKDISACSHLVDAKAMEAAGIMAESDRADADLSVCEEKLNTVLAIYECIGERSKLYGQTDTLDTVNTSITALKDNSTLDVDIRIKAHLLLMQLKDGKGSIKTSDRLDAILEIGANNPGYIQTAQKISRVVNDNLLDTVEQMKAVNEDLTGDSVNTFDKQVLDDFSAVVEKIKACFEKNSDKVGILNILNRLASAFIYRGEDEDKAVYVDKSVKDNVVLVMDAITALIDDEKFKDSDEAGCAVDIIYNLGKNCLLCNEVKQEAVNRLKPLADKHPSLYDKTLDYVCLLSDDDDLGPKEILHKYVQSVMETFASKKISQEVHKERGENLEKIENLLTENSSDAALLDAGLNNLKNIMLKTDERRNSDMIYEIEMSDVQEKLFTVIQNIVIGTELNIEKVFTPYLQMFSRNSKWLVQVATALNEVGKNKEPLVAIQMVVKFYAKYPVDSSTTLAVGFINERMAADTDETHHDEYMNCLTMLSVANIGFQSDYLSRIVNIFNTKDKSLKTAVKQLYAFFRLMLPKVQKRDQMEKTIRASIPASDDRMMGDNIITNEHVLRSETDTCMALLIADVMGDKFENELTTKEKSLIAYIKKIRNYLSGEGDEPEEMKEINVDFSEGDGLGHELSYEEKEERLNSMSDKEKLAHLAEEHEQWVEYAEDAIDMIGEIGKNAISNGSEIPLLAFKAFITLLSKCKGKPDFKKLLVRPNLRILEIMNAYPDPTIVDKKIVINNSKIDVVREGMVTIVRLVELDVNPDNETVADALATMKSFHETSANICQNFISLTCEVLNILASGVRVASSNAEALQTELWELYNSK